jgi:hypothetical protein
MNSSSLSRIYEDNHHSQHQLHQHQPHQPHHHDVFFARGHGVDKHPGNKIYRSLIRTHHHAYKAASNNKQMLNEIARSVIQPILSAGGTFYSQTKGAGSTITGTRNQELCHRELMKKVKQSLRDCKDPTNSTTSSISSSAMTTSSITADATSSNSDAVILNRHHIPRSPLQEHQDVRKEDSNSYDTSIHAHHTTVDHVWTDMPNNYQQQQQQQYREQYYNEPPLLPSSSSMIYEQEDSTMMTNMIMDNTTKTSSTQTQSRDDNFIDTIMNSSLGSFLVHQLDFSSTSINNDYWEKDDSRILLGNSSFQFNESMTSVGGKNDYWIDRLRDITMAE